MNNVVHGSALWHELRIKRRCADWRRKRSKSSREDAWQEVQMAVYFAVESGLSLKDVAGWAGLSVAGVHNVWRAVRDRIAYQLSVGTD